MAEMMLLLPAFGVALSQQKDFLLPSASYSKHLKKQRWDLPVIRLHSVSRHFRCNVFLNSSVSYLEVVTTKWEPEKDLSTASFLPHVLVCTTGN